MNLKAHCLLVVVLGVALLVSCEQPDYEVPYLNGTIALSQDPAYRETCRSEHTVLRPKEAARVERILLSAQITRAPLPYSEMAKITGELKVPAFGMSFKTADGESGSKLQLIEVEVPCRAKERVLLFRGDGFTYQLIDDFVYSTRDEDMFIKEVAVRGDQIHYVIGNRGRGLIRSVLHDSNGSEP